MENGGKGLFSLDRDDNGHRGSLPNSTHFITQTEIADVNLVRPNKKIKGAKGLSAFRHSSYCVTSAAIFTSGAMYNASELV